MKSKVRVAALTSSVFLLGMLTNQVMADQPHMQNAKENLRLAREELNLADSDKGGHKARAQELIREAMDEVQLGIDYARDNN